MNTHASCIIRWSRYYFIHQMNPIKFKILFDLFKHNKNCTKNQLSDRKSSTPSMLCWNKLNWVYHSTYIGRRPNSQPLAKLSNWVTISGQKYFNSIYEQIEKSLIYTPSKQNTFYKLKFLCFVYYISMHNRTCLRIENLRKHKDTST